MKRRLQICRCFTPYNHNVSGQAKYYTFLFAQSINNKSLLGTRDRTPCNLRYYGLSCDTSLKQWIVMIKDWKQRWQ